MLYQSKQVNRINSVAIASRLLYHKTHSPLPQNNMTSLNVGLPVGSSLGLHIAGNPPVVQAIDPDSPLAKAGIQPGMYVQTLLVSDAEYSYITDAPSLEEALHYYHDIPRTLVFTDVALEGPPSIKVTLPVGKLGIQLKGFPPSVVAVDKMSALYGKLPVGYVVDRLIIDGKELSLATGGFSDVNVKRALNESSHIEGRIMVVNNVTPLGDTRSSNRPFDLGAFVNHTPWSLGRMFGKEKSPSPKKLAP
jgi:hypothetical protein